MVRSKSIVSMSDVKGLLQENRDLLKTSIGEVVQETLEAEMEEASGPRKNERTEERVGYRSGYYNRTLITRVGKLALRVPQDRQGRFSTDLFECYQRSEKVLVAALAEIYIQSVSTGKVTVVTEQVGGHSFSAISISNSLRELRWLYDRRDLAEARKDLAAWLKRWQKKYAWSIAFRPSETVSARLPSSPGIDLIIWLTV